MEELQCLLLGYGPGAGWFTDGYTGTLFALPDSIRQSLSTAESELVESCLPFASNYRRLADFVTFIAGGGVLPTRAILDGSFQKLNATEAVGDFGSTKSPPCKVHRPEGKNSFFNGSGVSSPVVPGLYHTALFTVLRNRILPDYIAMVESIKCPADVGILKRSFESTFALLVPVVCHEVSDTESAKLQVLKSHSMYTRHAPSERRLYYPFGIHSAVWGIRGVPKEINMLPDTSDTLHGLSKFISSNDPPSSYREALHEVMHMSLLYHIGYFVAHGKLLSTEASELNTKVSNDRIKVDAAFYSRTTGYGGANRDFFLQPKRNCTQIAEEDDDFITTNIDERSEIDEDVCASSLVVDTSKLPLHISPHLAGLILAAGRERSLLIKELQLADEEAEECVTVLEEPTPPQRSDRRIHFESPSTANENPIWSSPFYAPGAEARKSVLDVFHVAIPQTKPAIELFSTITKNLKSSKVAPHERQVLPHAKAARLVFSLIHNVELCRSTEKAISTRFADPTDFGSTNSMMEGVLGASGRWHQSNNCTSRGSQFFGVLNVDDLELRVSVARAMWSAALWGIVKNGGVADASAAAIEECDLMVVKKAKVGLLSAALLSQHERKTKEEAGINDGSDAATSSLDMTTKSDPISGGAGEDESNAGNDSAESSGDEEVVPLQGLGTVNAESQGNELSPLRSVISRPESIGNATTKSQRIRRRWQSATARTAISTISIPLSSLFYQLSVLRDMFMCHRGNFWQTFVETTYLSFCGQPHEFTGKRPDLNRSAHEAFRQACLSCSAASLNTFAPVYTREEALIAARRALRRHSSGFGSASSMQSGFSSAATEMSGLDSPVRGASYQHYNLKLAGGHTVETASAFGGTASQAGSRFGQSTVGTVTSKFKHRSIDQLHQVVTRITPRSSAEEELTFLEDSFSMSVAPVGNDDRQAPSVGHIEMINEGAALAAIKRVSKINLHFHPTCGSAHLVVSSETLSTMQSVFQLHMQMKFAMEALNECRRTLGSFSTASFQTTGSVKDKTLVALQSTVPGAAVYTRICNALYGQLGDHRRPNTGAMPRAFVSRGVISTIMALVSKIQFLLSTFTSFLMLDIQQREYDVFIRKFCATLSDAGHQLDSSRLSNRRSGIGAHVDADGVATVQGVETAAGTSVGASGFDESEVLPFRPTHSGKQRVTFAEGSAGGRVEGNAAGAQRHPHVFSRSDNISGTSSVADINSTFSSANTGPQQYAPPDVQTVEAARKAHDKLLRNVSRGSFIPTDPPIKDTSLRSSCSTIQIAQALAELLSVCHMTRNVVTSSQLFVPAQSHSGHSSPVFTLNLSNDATKSVSLLHQKLSREIMPHLYGHLSTSPRREDRLLWTRINFNRWFRTSADENTQPATHATAPVSGGVRAMQRQALPTRFERSPIQAPHATMGQPQRNPAEQLPAQNEYNTLYHAGVYSLASPDRPWEGTGPF